MKRTLTSHTQWVKITSRKPYHTWHAEITKRMRALGYRSDDPDEDTRFMLFEHLHTYLTPLPRGFKWASQPGR